MAEVCLLHYRRQLQRRYFSHPQQQARNVLFCSCVAVATSIFGIEKSPTWYSAGGTAGSTAGSQDSSEIERDGDEDMVTVE